MPNKIVGILGGVGPYAGIDLLRKIHDNTIVSCDQDHLNLIFYSLPQLIPDRSEYLLGASNNNPGIIIGNLFLNIAYAGADMIVMPCNTAHNEKILKVALDILYSKYPSVRFVNMVDVLIEYIVSNFSQNLNVGLLSTKGTIISKLYESKLLLNQLNPIIPDLYFVDMLHDAIYNKNYGIKAKSNPIENTVKNIIYKVMENLVSKGADILLLSCTELPLAIDNNNFFNIPILDCNNILARYIVLNVSPLKLKLKF